MLNQLLANFYEKDLLKLIEEVNLFQKEEDLWKTLGTVKNSAGNLNLILIRIDHIRLRHPPDLPILQPDLYAPRMICRRGQNILYDAIGQIAASLILLENYSNFQSRMNVFSILAVHTQKYLFFVTAGRQHLL